MIHNPVFRLFGLSLHVEIDTFQYIGSHMCIPCGVSPKSRACYSLWVEATDGYLKVPEPGQHGQESICKHCSFQLACLGGQPHKAIPEALPVISSQQFIVDNVILVNLPHLVHAPFDNNGA